MKQKWIEPITVKEEFMPNEYVAACETHNKYTLRCTRGGVNGDNPDNTWSDDKKYHENDPGTCGATDSQVIITDANGIVTNMYEANKYNGDETIYIYQGGNYVDIKNANFKLTCGENLDWYTGNPPTNFYHHTGIVECTNIGSKVMS